MILNKIHNFTHCGRYNGGPNAGHTIYHNNKKLVTHQVPTGIIYGLKCVIGPNCALDIKKLQDEIDMLKKHGIQNIEENLKISFNTYYSTQAY